MTGIIQGIKNLQVTSSLKQGIKYIGTHNGTFHCDEALAVSMLKTLPQYAEHHVLRTRDNELLKNCDIVVDVGGEYNPETHRFDHHQKTFNGTLENYNTKLSSAGLVYKHFGREIIQAVSGKKFDDKILNIIYDKIYSGFVEHIDGIDNGIEVATGTINYRVTTSLSSRVGFLNPQWNEESSVEAMNEAFKKAVLLTGTEFTEAIQHLVNGWLPARSIVEKVVNDRFKVDPSGSILHLTQYCPWKKHLTDIEEEMKIGDQIKFVIYEDALGSMHRIQGINVEEGSFALRLGLPAEWRGLRDEELSTVSGIEGCTFVHAAGFIGGNKTYEGALEMARKALAAAN